MSWTYHWHSKDIDAKDWHTKLSIAGIHAQMLDVVDTVCYNRAFVSWQCSQCASPINVDLCRLNKLTAIELTCADCDVKYTSDKMLQKSLMGLCAVAQHKILKHVKNDELTVLIKSHIK